MSADEAGRAEALERGFAGWVTGAVDHDGTRIGYRVAGDGPTVLLVHGFPESGYEWHRVAPLLAQRYRVVVPDYRGAAGSDVPTDGYDKTTMAADLHAVLSALADPTVDPDVDSAAAHVVGHDIGTTIAYAYARRYPAEVRSLTLLEGIVPGTATLAAIVASGAAWHFAFHQQVDLATRLIEGREDVYVDYFLDTFLFDPTSVGVEDRRFYADALRRPGAVRAAVSTYAAWFGPDAVDNRTHLEQHGLLTVPTLAVGGDRSMGAAMAAVAADVAGRVTPVTVAAGHFLTDEAPDELARLLLEHLDAHR